MEYFYSDCIHEFFGGERVLNLLQLQKIKLRVRRFKKETTLLTTPIIGQSESNPAEKIQEIASSLCNYVIPEPNIVPADDALKYYFEFKKENFKHLFRGVYLNITLYPRLDDPPLCSNLNMTEVDLGEPIHLLERFDNAAESGAESFVIERQIPTKTLQPGETRRISDCWVDILYTIFVPGDDQTIQEDDGKSNIKDGVCHLKKTEGSSGTTVTEISRKESMRPAPPSMFTMKPTYQASPGSALISWGLANADFVRYVFIAYLRPDLSTDTSVILPSEELCGNDYANKKNVIHQKTAITKSEWRNLDRSVRQIKIDSPLSRQNAGVTILACLILEMKDGVLTVETEPSYLIVSLTPSGVQDLSVRALNEESSSGSASSGSVTESGFRLSFKHQLPCQSVFTVVYQLEHGREKCQNNQVESPKELSMEEEINRICTIDEEDDLNTGIGIGRELSLTVSPVPPGYYFISIQTLVKDDESISTSSVNVLDPSRRQDNRQLSACTSIEANPLGSETQVDRVSVFEHYDETALNIQDKGFGVIKVTTKAHKFCDRIVFIVEDVGSEPHPNYADSIITNSDYQKLKSLPRFPTNINRTENPEEYRFKRLQLEEIYQSKAQMLTRYPKIRKIVKLCTKYHRLHSLEMSVAIPNNFYQTRYKVTTNIYSAPDDEAGDTLLLDRYTKHFYFMRATALNPIQVDYYKNHSSYIPDEDTDLALYKEFDLKFVGYKNLPIKVRSTNAALKLALAVEYDGHEQDRNEQLETVFTHPYNSPGCYFSIDTINEDYNLKNSLHYLFDEENMLVRIICQIEIDDDYWTGISRGKHITIYRQSNILGARILDSFRENQFPDQK